VKTLAVMVALHALAVAWLTAVAAMMFSEGKAVAGVLISLLALVIVGVTVTVAVCDPQIGTDSEWKPTATVTIAVGMTVHRVAWFVSSMSDSIAR
jgi:hypothetical protein